MNSKLKPKIRFKGFTDDWVQRKLANVFNYERPDKYIVSSTEYLEFGPTPVLTANKAFILGYTTEKNKYVNSKESIIFDDFTLDTKFVDFPYMVKSSAIKILTLKDATKDNNRFNFELLSNHKFNMLGHARHYISVVQPEEVFTTNKQEQSKIGELFTNLDKLITLHQRKCDKLIEIKKSLLEKMFPQNNSVIPEIRFRGFTDDWEQRKLNDIYTFSQGMQVEIENQSLNKSVDMEQFIRIIDVTTNSEPPRYIYNTTGKGHVESNDIFFVRYGAVGTVGYGYTGTIANNLFKLSTNKKYCNDFMYQQFANGEFNKKLIEMSASTSMPAINFSALNSLTFYETNLDEQNRIGKLFKSIDNLITLHQRKHDKLNKIKQSLLNDMFV